MMVCERYERTRVAKSAKAADSPFFFLLAFILLAVATRISAKWRIDGRVKSMRGRRSGFSDGMHAHKEKNSDSLSRNFAFFVTLRFWCDGRELSACGGKGVRGMA